MAMRFSMPRSAWCVAVSAFLMVCISSSTTRSNRLPRNCSKRERTRPYVVSVTGTSGM